MVRIQFASQFFQKNNFFLDFRVWSRVLGLADIALLRVGIESITLPCVSGLDQLISMYVLG